ncbi:MAG TPA: hypothetical protein VL096_15325 [Pirellulaceae bacterium]|nr:hypothetical protein [Pirellulaceae bacterium]
MALFLALEWDGNEARVALARKRGHEAVIEDAFTIELEPREAGQTFAAPSVGARVAAALAARNVGRVDTLVAVGRKDIELRVLSVPPAPPEELPEVVRFQALRQFTTLGEDWPLDYVSLGVATETPTSVLAAALSPENIKQIRSTCEAGNLSPRRMVLRPMASASLLSRQLPDATGRCRLMVDVLSDEADLTVLIGERVVFLRTIRLPAHDQVEAQNTALVGELRRTMIAAQNQLGGRRVEYVIVCGNPKDHTGLIEKLGRDLSMPIECFDPFAALPLSDDLARHLPERHGRFAPLLGMLLDEAAGTPHAIDFLNPRKRPPAPDRRRQRVLMATAAGVLVAAIGGFFWMQSAELSSKIAAAQAELRDLEKTVAISQKKIAEANEIDKFAYGDITWLDEFHRLSDPQYFPAGEEVILDLVYGATREVRKDEVGGGKLSLEGHVREASVIRTMEDKIRGNPVDPRHTVTGSGGQEDDSSSSYRWKFKEEITIIHPDAPLPVKKPAAATKPATGKKS